MKRCAARDHKLCQAGGGGDEGNGCALRTKRSWWSEIFSQRFSQLARRRSTIDKLSWAGESALRQLSKPYERPWGADQTRPETWAISALRSKQNWRLDTQWKQQQQHQLDKLSRWIWMRKKKPTNERTNECASEPAINENYSQIS